MYSSLIGPLGQMIEVRSPTSMPVSIDRPAASLTLANGQRATYRTPRHSREWQWNIPFSTDDEIDDLLALEAGAYGPGPWRWYDPMAARTNMLPDVVAACGTGPMPWRWLTDQPSNVTPTGPIQIGDRTIANSIAPATTLRLPVRNGEPDPVPVIPGKTYTASVYVSNGDGRISLEWIGQSNTVISREQSAFSTGRISVTGEAPTDAVGATVMIETGTVGQALEINGIGSYAVAPYDPRMDVAGLDATVTFALRESDTVSHQALISRYQLDEGQRIWSFRISPQRKLYFQWSEDGMAVRPNFLSDDALDLSLGEVVTARVVFVPDLGDGTHMVEFYFGRGEATELFYRSVRTGTTSMHAGPAQMEVGSNHYGANPLPGDIYHATVRNLEGEIVADPKFDTGSGWTIGDDSSSPPVLDSLGNPFSLMGDAVIAERIQANSSVRIGGIQLTETDTVVPWRHGMGMPRVSLDIKSSDYARLTRDDKYRSVSLTLIEVA